MPHCLFEIVERLGKLRVSPARAAGQIPGGRIVGVDAESFPQRRFRRDPSVPSRREYPPALCILRAGPDRARWPSAFFRVLRRFALVPRPAQRTDTRIGVGRGGLGSPAEALRQCGRTPWRLATPWPATAGRGPIAVSVGCPFVRRNSLSGSPLGQPGVAELNVPLGLARLLYSHQAGQFGDADA